MGGKRTGSGMKWVREPDVDSRRRGEWATHGFLVRGEELGASPSGVWLQEERV